MRGLARTRDRFRQFGSVTRGANFDHSAAWRPGYIRIHGGPIGTVETPDVGWDGTNLNTINP